MPTHHGPDRLQRAKDAPAADSQADAEPQPDAITRNAVRRPPESGPAFRRRVRPGYASQAL